MAIINASGGWNSLTETMHGLDREHWEKVVGYNLKCEDMLKLTKWTAINAYKALFWDPQRLREIESKELQHILVCQGLCYGVTASIMSVKAALVDFGWGGRVEALTGMSCIMEANECYKELIEALSLQLVRYISSIKGPLRGLRADQLQAYIKATNKV